MVPGTEIMDADGRAKKALIPVPSSDPRDPLNWSKKWKRELFVQSMQTVLKRQ